MPGWHGTRGRAVHVLERALEGVLLPLLAPVAVHQFLQGQVVPRHQDHRVLRHQQKLASPGPAADHHVVLHPVPAAGPVRREDGFLLHADVRPRRVGKAFEPFQHGPFPPGIRQAESSPTRSVP